MAREKLEQNEEILAEFRPHWGTRLRLIDPYGVYNISHRDTPLHKIWRNSYRHSFGLKAPQGKKGSPIGLFLPDAGKEYSRAGA